MAAADRIVAADTTATGSTEEVRKAAQTTSVAREGAAIVVLAHTTVGTSRLAQKMVLEVAAASRTALEAAPSTPPLAEALAAESAKKGECLRDAGVLMSP